MGYITVERQGGSVNIRSVWGRATKLDVALSLKWKGEERNIDN